MILTSSKAHEKRPWTSFLNNINRKLVLLLMVLTIFSQKAEARIGYNFNYFTPFYGFHSISGQTLFQRFDFVVTKSNQRCFRQKGPFKYYGFGASYSFNNNFEEFGILASFRPRARFLAISRGNSFVPIVYGQLGIKSNKEFQGQSDINGRFGFGLDGFFIANSKGALRSSIQVGYIFNDTFITNQSGFTFELKVGYGIHSFKRRKKSEKD